MANAQEDNDEIQMTKADSVKLSGRHLSFGGRYLNSKQYEDAEIQLKKAWGYNPTRSTTARYLGKLYKETDRLDDSIETYSATSGAITITHSFDELVAGTFAFAGVLYCLMSQDPDVFTTDPCDVMNLDLSRPTISVVGSFVATRFEQPDVINQSLVAPPIGRTAGVGGGPDLATDPAQRLDSRGHQRALRRCGLP